jgi:hypothetical protein
MTVSFHTTKEQARLIGLIVSRAKRMWKQARPDERFDAMSLHMDLSACIAQGCNLKLNELLNADDFNFCHDVFGISRHINRDTGKLENFFVPRYKAYE